MAAAFFNLPAHLFLPLPELVDIHFAEIAVNLVWSQFPAAVWAFWICVRNFHHPAKFWPNTKMKAIEAIEA